MYKALPSSVICPLNMDPGSCGGGPCRVRFSLTAMQVERQALSFKEESQVRHDSGLEPQRQ